MRQSYFLKNDPTTQVDMIVSTDGRLIKRTYIDRDLELIKEVRYDVRQVEHKFNPDCDLNSEERAKMLAARAMLARYLLCTPQEVNNN